MAVACRQHKQRTPRLLAALVGLLVGKDPDGLSLASGTILADLAQWRAPRIAVAAAAGGMLAAAGVVIQRVTSNPLASPEVLGVGTGAGAGLAAVLLLAGMPGLAWQLTGSAIGALAVLAAILILGARGNLGPERLLFAGIALNALCSAVLTAVIALGNMQSYVLLRWLSGSTSEAGTVHALVGLAALLVLSTPLLVLARWLEVLPLGDATARALGLPVRAARATLVVIAALASAFAAMFVGPLSFIGLIAPHLARLFGLGRARQHLVGSVLLGALLMIASDWLSRMAAFPYQLPVGLFASLLGGPYLIYLLGKGVQRHG
jgi:iron complex transport system permease protein